MTDRELLEENNKMLKEILSFVRKGYSKEEFDKVNKESKDPELESINSFNDTVKKSQ